MNQSDKERKEKLEKQYDYLDRRIAEYQEDIDKLSCELKDKNQKLNKLYILRDNVEEELADIDCLDCDLGSEFEVYMLKQLLHCMIDSFI